ncbi:MAG TPA: reverse transcriptase domain-containing protein [Verrucomicrobiae bacterium]|nr:reverse transcriptase domain-containing protein [Verrucomicrobiae bacterium]
MESSACIRRELADHLSYERQIERLQNRGRDLHQGKVSLGWINIKRSALARILAETIARGEYHLAPARRKTIVIKGKSRVVFNYGLTDRIVNGAVADAVNLAMAPELSTRLYSYRKGMSWWNAVADFARYLRLHCKQNPEPQKRHMYVLRWDIDAYTDSIPVGNDAPVWAMLRKLLPPEEAPALWNLLEQVVRPKIEVCGTTPIQLDRGVPTGQPISCVLFNLYLAELDRFLETVPGAFYARYSDDLIFAHPSFEIARRIGAEIRPFLAHLGLRVSPSKSKELYLTGAGRPSADWPEATGTSEVPFMGMAVQADGMVSLGRKKTRHMLREVNARVRRVMRSLPGASVDDAGRMACASVNQMFTIESISLVEANSAALVRYAITNRRQLAQLDHCIALIVLGAVIGDSSAKAFRTISYRKLREEWGLISLEHARNRVARKRSA